jgi:hypothetical protein
VPQVAHRPRIGRPSRLPAAGLPLVAQSVLLSETPDLITDLVQIRQLGEKKLDENRKFRVFMKTRDYSDRILRRTAERIEDRIDCTECGNCCKTSTTEVTERDIEKLARHLHTTSERFIADYTMIEEDDGEMMRVLRFTEGTGCVFLEGKPRESSTKVAAGHVYRQTLQFTCRYEILIR